MGSIDGVLWSLRRQVATRDDVVSPSSSSAPSTSARNSANSNDVNDEESDSNDLDKIDEMPDDDNADADDVASSVDVFDSPQTIKRVASQSAATLSKPTKKEVS